MGAPSTLFLIMSLGLDPHDDVDGVPPTDSMDMSAVILGTNMTSPRTEMVSAATQLQLDLQCE